MSALMHPLQHISGKDHDRRLRRSRRHCQHWRQNNHQSPEEQTGFRAGRSTTEQNFNLRILCEKYLQHQQDLNHVFTDFKKAIDRVWHATLWAAMKKYNISTDLIQVIKNLYNKATSAVLFESSIED